MVGAGLGGWGWGGRGGCWSCVCVFVCLGGLCVDGWSCILLCCLHALCFSQTQGRTGQSWLSRQKPLLACCPECRKVGVGGAREGGRGFCCVCIIYSCLGPTVRYIYRHAHIPHIPQQHNKTNKNTIKPKSTPTTAPPALLHLPPAHGLPQPVPRAAAAGDFFLGQPILLVCPTNFQSLSKRFACADFFTHTS